MGEYTVPFYKNKTSETIGYLFWVTLTSIVLATGISYLKTDSHEKIAATQQNDSLEKRISS